MPSLKTFDELLKEVYVLHKRGRFEEAAQVYRELLRLRPNNPALTGLLGLLRYEQGRLDEADRLLEKACRLDPRSASSHFHWGLVLKEIGRQVEAAAAFGRAYELDPSFPRALSEFWQTSLDVCDWRRFDDLARELLAAARRKIFVEPFALLLATDEPADLLDCARASVANNVEQNKHLLRPTPFAQNPVPAGRKIRVAYRSADFRAHATAHLISELVELHDRSRFEVVALSVGPDDRSDARRRLEISFDRFTDTLDWPLNETSQRIHALDIDILVDLMGHTRWNRMEFLASRPAKIQVNFLGYPGTTGADFIDYVIVDPFVAPPGHERHFSEKLVRLPDCYQVNDRRRPLGERPESRAQYGLPEMGFVFCCFNRANKLDPHIFDVWMRLLRAMPGSVLWLLEETKPAVENLRREADARGVDPDRLVFAPKVSPAAHLGRHQLADLSLDTMRYNAHTTASDSLWAGVPIVTCPGQSFAARVCGSLLIAVGLSELIVNSLEEYEALAVALANDGARLAELRRRLADGRESAPLFDTPRFCRNLEKAFETMVEIQRKGGQPRSFDVQAEAR